MNKAFFLDRDGTINVDYNYVHEPEEWTWCEGAIDALQWITKHRYKIIVVTNQSGIAKGKYSEEDVQHLHAWVDEKLQKHDVEITGWYYAPHHPQHDSEGRYVADDRKPGTGMFEKAAKKFNIDFSRSYMAGDKISDLIPAVALGITPFFIRSRHESDQNTQWLRDHNIPTFDNIYEAVSSI